MTTRRKVLLVIFVVMAIFYISIYWRTSRLNNQLNKMIIDLKDLNNNVSELEAVFKNQRHLPEPTNGVNKSYHDGGYENAWILDVDKNTGLVLVKTVDSKMSVTFKPTTTNLRKFRIGSIAPVTFQCTKENKGKCDLNAPYKLFIRNALVELKELKF